MSEIMSSDVLDAQAAVDVQSATEPEEETESTTNQARSDPQHEPDAEAATNEARSDPQHEPHGHSPEELSHTSHPSNRTTSTEVTDAHEEETTPSANAEAVVADGSLPLPSKEEKSEAGFWGGIHKRLGKLAISFILGGTLVALGIWGFWTFLWFADDSNPTWHWIMVNDHLKVILTSSAETLNRFVGFMLGVECSMVLGLALERSEVLFPNLVSASIGRSGSGAGKTVSMMKKIGKGKWPFRGWDIRLPFIVTLLFLIENLTLGTHTILFTDIKLGPIATRSNSSDVYFGFTYHNATITDAGGYEDVLTSRGSAWTLKPPSYPVFAEYTEDAFVKQGVSDTGVTLRAFLPYTDSSIRQNIHTYTGRTTVLDARVTCQIPYFDNITAQYQGDLVLGGYVGASTFTPRLGNRTWISPFGSSGSIQDGPVPFVCAVPLKNSSTFGVPDQWRISICQLANTGEYDVGTSGGLVSEFRNYTAWLDAPPDFEDASNFGTAYIIFNVSTGSIDEWQEILPSKDSQPMILSQPQNVNEWSAFSLTSDLSFSATLCYSAFDTADIPVTITSSDVRNQTEPEPQFNSGSKRYTFDDVRKQYGQGSDHNSSVKSLENRGIFQLENQSWIAGPGIQSPEYSYIRQYASLAGYASESGNAPYWSGFMLAADSDSAGSASDYNITSNYYRDQYPSVQLYTVTPDPMHYWLFQDILANGGSVAFALQSHLTTLASMMYYDQIAQFDSHATVTKSVFIETNLPLSYWGWLSVTIVLFIHIFLAWIVVLWFITSTKYTMLGQDWQHVAHVTNDETKDYILMAERMSDDDLKEKMEKIERVEGQPETSLSKTRVRLRSKEGKVGIYIVDSK